MVSLVNQFSLAVSNSFYFILCTDLCMLLINILIYIYYMFSCILILVNASQAGAGNLEIIVAVNGKNVPNYVQSEGNAKFRVNFKPQEAAVHSLSVRFNGEPVPGI